MEKTLKIIGLINGLLIINSHAAVLSWTGISQNADLGVKPWVLTSTMWESVDTGSASATGNVGFSSIDLSGSNTFGWTFGDLELTSWQSPGAATPGFEIYTEGDASLQPFIMTYNGVDVASGEVQFLRVDVDNVNDVTAVGTAEIIMNSSLGPDPTVFNEILALTGNSGLVTVDIFNFDPVDAFGQFSSSGTLTAVPEPTTISSILGFSGLVCAVFFKRRKN